MTAPHGEEALGGMRPQKIYFKAWKIQMPNI